MIFDAIVYGLMIGLGTAAAMIPIFIVIAALDKYITLKERL